MMELDNKFNFPEIVEFKLLKTYNVPEITSKNLPKPYEREMFFKLLQKIRENKHSEIDNYTGMIFLYYTFISKDKIKLSNLRIILENAFFCKKMTSEDVGKILYLVKLGDEENSETKALPELLEKIKKENLRTEKLYSMLLEKEAKIQILAAETEKTFTLAKENTEKIEKFSNFISDFENIKKIYLIMLTFILTFVILIK